jgi:hypothetical protein
MNCMYTSVLLIWTDWSWNQQNACTCSSLIISAKVWPHYRRVTFTYSWPYRTLWSSQYHVCIFRMYWVRRSCESHSHPDYAHSVARCSEGSCRGTLWNTRAQLLQIMWHFGNNNSYMMNSMTTPLKWGRTETIFNIEYLWNSTTHNFTILHSVALKLLSWFNIIFRPIMRIQSSEIMLIASHLMTSR